jgi:hypothetical protein
MREFFVVPDEELRRHAQIGTRCLPAAHRVVKVAGGKLPFTRFEVILPGSQFGLGDPAVVLELLLPWKTVPPIQRPQVFHEPIIVPAVVDIA